MTPGTRLNGPHHDLHYQGFSPIQPRPAPRPKDKPTFNQDPNLLLTYLNRARSKEIAEMSQREDIETEKALSNLESAKMPPTTDTTAEGDILEPLQFILAARRGIHQDPSFVNSQVPDDRAITFRGPSGVKPAPDRSSRWSRFVRYLGYLPTR